MKKWPTFNSVPWQIGSSGGHEGRFSGDPPPFFFWGGPCEQFLHGQLYMSTLWRCSSSVSSAGHGITRPPRCPEGCFGEAVIAGDMPEPSTFLSLDSCQKRFMWTHDEVDLAMHPVVGLVFQTGDTEKFPHALGFENLDPFSESASRIHVSQP